MFGPNFPRPTLIVPLNKTLVGPVHRVPSPYLHRHLGDAPSESSMVELPAELRKSTPGESRSRVHELNCLADLTDGALDEMCPLLNVGFCD